MNTQPNPLTTPGPLLAKPFGPTIGQQPQTPLATAARAPQIKSATGDVAQAQYQQQQALKAGVPAMNGQAGLVNQGIATSTQ